MMTSSEEFIRAKCFVCDVAAGGGDEVSRLIGAEAGDEMGDIMSFAFLAWSAGEPGDECMSN